MSLWFRAYSEALNDPKIQRLSDRAFRAWHNAMYLAASLDSTDGDIGTLDDVSFAFRETKEAVSSAFHALQEAGLIETVGETFRIVAWRKRQYKSDTSTERVRKHRKRSRNATVTAPDTDTETDTEQKVISSAPPAAAPTKPKPDRGTRWPKDQPVPDSWHEPVLARFRELGRAPPDIPLEAVKFAAYWTSKSGKDATKLDWQKTFLNWCLNARPDQRKPKQSTHRDFLDAGIDVAREYLADGGDAGGGGGAADAFGRPLLPA